MSPLSEELSLDFETRSTVKLRKAGLYVYAQHPTTEIMCMAWAIGGMVPELWLPGQRLPERFVDHVGSGGGLRAWNAAFERIIWWHKLSLLVPEYASIFPKLEQWTCTAAEAAAMALPRGLGKCAEVLGVDDQKDKEGHRLMMKYSRPRKVDEDGTITWWEDPDDLRRIYSYCGTDVRAERAIARLLLRLRPKERALWLLDQRVNDRGIYIDIDLVRAGQAAVARETERANARIQVVTGGEATGVTQVKALTTWLQARIPLDNMQKQTIKDTLEQPNLPVDVREVLELRQDVGRTSVAKYAKVDEVICRDNFARGLTLYHGASTGRWTGRLLQPHNFPKPELDPAPFHDRLMARAWALIEMEEQLMKVVVSSLRGIFIPSLGDFFSADFSQIEARILGWLAGEPYRKHEYEKMGAAIYQMPWREVEHESMARHIGKNTTLGCGFGMGWEKFIVQAYEKAGIVVDEELAQRAVRIYRDEKPGIVRYWREIEGASFRAMHRPGEIVRYGGVRFVYRGQFLWCVLPSGRPLAYALPSIRLVKTPWEAMVPAITYMGMDSRKSSRKWERIHTYGGHLTENVVQAIARDMLAEAMLRVEDAGYRVVLTVHDEILAEKEDGDLDEFLALMQERPTWGQSCPIEAEGWRGDRWHK